MIDFIKPNETKRRKKMAKKNARWRKEQRREVAKERHEARGQRSPHQQLERLDQMFGKNQGAQKERAKLLATIADHETKTKTETNIKKEQSNV